MATADSLTHRLDALGAALLEAGVDADRVSRVLGSAATATMNALLLDAVVEESLHPPAAAPVEAPHELDLKIVEHPLRAAA